MYTNNGTNFVCADKELRELLLHVESHMVQELTTNKGAQVEFQSTDGTTFRWST